MFDLWVLWLDAQAILYVIALNYLYKYDPFSLINVWMLS